jgi:hypothetical protein
MMNSAIEELLGEFPEDGQDGTEKDLKPGFGQVTLNDENRCKIE